MPQKRKDVLNLPKNIFIPFFQPPTQFYDWKQHFAEEGYLVLTSRSRSSDGSEETIVSSVLKKVFKLQNQITMESIMRGALLGMAVLVVEFSLRDKKCFWLKINCSQMK